ncbi:MULTISPECIES: chemotaxis response regulator protein-glutamate methylesterase [Calothrix]|uniref:Protein-glutamate methylesterase/protein-glutamine glutaminase n=2 Tax=Calothrix TaxID=1186 RepID=A0ABR8AAN4_9CYAN|nr:MULTISPECIES: chemotaxis response regulator protein-glutamate methylesterase [Calothrix]MBD2197060.1 chemotaxis response regulator protein-glutamate methylesterase [Calothrix parietina FACHB-288]MBD2225719.1 chemotaxis response regulator protein-glutamate methylesterase [Calothrix anomala FACHB-343]
MRIAIVNDMLMAVEVLRRILSKIPEYDLAWVAYDGLEAVQKCAVDTPDLILMDVLMPTMDGVEATRCIMNQSPCAILLVTASVNRYAAKVFEAMGYGALDAINTPTEGSAGLLKKIAAIASLIGKSSRQKLVSGIAPKSQFWQKPLPPIIAIGASTGGPQALVKILSQFPQNFPAAVIVVQHLDAEFAPGFASWLNEQIPMSVQIAIAGSTPQPGKILMAGTNRHLIMRSDLSLDYDAEPAESFYHPSVDVLFRSLANHWPETGIGVLLTGMGRDGAQGLKLMREAGWQTIVQDSKTCVVYGMPKAAVELNAAVQILPVEAIASACTKFLLI